MIGIDMIRNNRIYGNTHGKITSQSDSTDLIKSNPTHGKVYSIQHYVIKFVSDLRQAGGFLRVLPFPPPIKLTTTR
jgi:hypothetical protein